MSYIFYLYFLSLFEKNFAVQLFARLFNRVLYIGYLLGLQVFEPMPPTISENAVFDLCGNEELLAFQKEKKILQYLTQNILVLSYFGVPQDKILHILFLLQPIRKFRNCISKYTE